MEPIDQEKEAAAQRMGENDNNEKRNSLHGANAVMKREQDVGDVRT